MRTTFVAAGLVAVVAADKYTTTAVVHKTVTSCGPEVTDCPAKVNHWANWDPSEEDGSSTTEDAAASHTWAEWESSTTDATVTDPAVSHTWAEWESSTTDAAVVDPSHTWAEWESSSTTDAEITDSASHTWAEWESSTTDNATPTEAVYCPSYTSTGVPAWFSQLPESELSSIKAKWTGAPPSDWCYYSYTTGVVTKTTDVVPVISSAAASTWSEWAPGATGVSPVNGGANGPVNGGANGPVNGGAYSSGGSVYDAVSATGPAIPQWTGAAPANGASMAVVGLAGLAAILMA